MKKQKRNSVKSKTSKRNWSVNRLNSKKFNGNMKLKKRKKLGGNRKKKRKLWKTSEKQMTKGRRGRTRGKSNRKKRNRVKTTQLEEAEVKRRRSLIKDQSKKIPASLTMHPNTISLASFRKRHSNLLKKMLTMRSFPNFLIHTCPWRSNETCT